MPCNVRSRISGDLSLREVLFLGDFCSKVLLKTPTSTRHEEVRRFKSSVAADVSINLQSRLQEERATGILILIVR